MGWWWWFLIAATACGRISFDPQQPDIGDGATDGRAPDGRAPGTCGPATLVLGVMVANQDDHSPTLTPDQLTIWWVVGLLGTTDIWTATRATTSEAFGNAHVVSELGAPGENESPWVSMDGLTMLFASGRSGQVDLYSATRATTAALFGSVTALTVFNVTGGTDGYLSYSSDSLRAFMHSDRLGAGFDLYSSQRTTTGSAFSPPALIAELDTNTFNDRHPNLSADGLRILFVSNRPGGVGVSDIWTSTRPSVTSLWDPPVPFVALNTAAEEISPFLAADGRTVYFASDRPGSELLDLWVADCGF